MDEPREAEHAWRQVLAARRRRVPTALAIRQPRPPPALGLPDQPDQRAPRPCGADPHPAGPGPAPRGQEHAVDRRLRDHRARLLDSARPQRRGARCRGESDRSSRKRGTCGAAGRRLGAADTRRRHAPRRPAGRPGDGALARRRSRHAPRSTQPFMSLTAVQICMLGAVPVYAALRRLARRVLASDGAGVFPSLFRAMPAALGHLHLPGSLASRSSTLRNSSSSIGREDLIPLLLGGWVPAFSYLALLSHRTGWPHHHPHAPPPLRGRRPSPTGSTMCAPSAARNGRRIVTDSRARSSGRRSSAPRSTAGCRPMAAPAILRAARRSS